MKELEEFDRTFEKYKKEDIYIPQIPEKEADKKLIEYVYESNKLEGNQLNLAETTEILTNNRTTGNKRLVDYLEAKGHYKALKMAILAAKKKEPLSENLIRSFNENTLKVLWGLEESYYDWKQKGQKPGRYKVEQNRIYYHYEGKDGKIDPLSNPGNVERNMKKIIETVNGSKDHIIKKASLIAYNIFIHQPFIDGNKRTSRLTVTYLTMKEGLPLTVFNQQKGFNYNEALLLTYMEKEPSIFVKFISKEFRMGLEKMIQENIELNKNTKKGYSLTF